MSDPFVGMKVRDSSLRGLEAALKALPAEVASRSGGPLKGALFKAADVFVKAAQANAESLPVSDEDERDDYVRTGALARSIRKKRDPRPTDVTERVVVKPRGGRRGQQSDKRDRAPYWHLVEFGTEKMPARPFMRPAANAHWPLALSVFKAALVKGIERAARKAARLGLSRG